MLRFGFSAKPGTHKNTGSRMSLQANNASRCTDLFRAGRRVSAGKGIVIRILFQGREEPLSKRIDIGPSCWGLLSCYAAATLGVVQRLFSMFPSGRAGVALLLLRVAAATTLIVDGMANWASVTSF